MKKLLTLTALCFVFAAFLAVPVYADGEGDHSHEETTVSQETEQNQAEQTEVKEAYSYVAQVDDSYTVLARKAIQTYGIETSTNLSGAEIVFAETHLTQDAGGELLNEGQEVSIDKEDVKKVVEEAQKLSDAEEAAWDYYVQFIDFNTDAAGQTS